MASIARGLALSFIAVSANDDAADADLNVGLVPTPLKGMWPKAARRFIESIISAARLL